MCLAASGCMTGPKSKARVYPVEVTKLIGEWTGSFVAESRSDVGDAVTRNITMRISLSQGRRRVFVLEDRGWEEKKPGLFVMESIGPNALIYSIDDGRTPNGGPWVETWIVAITARTPSELLTRWVRVVNNIDTPLTNPDSKYTFDGEGILKRVEE